MAFHHDSKGRAHFGSHSAHTSPTAGKHGDTHGATMHEKGKQAPHADVGEKHVTTTHPGLTKPHPSTGVHAFHAQHLGGGRYQSHTHHEDGTVEKREHPDHADMMSALHEALPPEEQGTGEENDQRDGGMDFAEQLGTGIGGHSDGMEV